MNLLLWKVWVGLIQKLSAMFTLYRIILNLFGTEGALFHYQLSWIEQSIRLFFSVYHANKNYSQWLSKKQEDGNILFSRSVFKIAVLDGGYVSWCYDSTYLLYYQLKMYVGKAVLNIPDYK